MRNKIINLLKKTDYILNEEFEFDFFDKKKENVFYNYDMAVSTSEIQGFALKGLKEIVEKIDNFEGDVIRTTVLKFKNNSEELTLLTDSQYEKLIAFHKHFEKI